MLTAIHYIASHSANTERYVGVSLGGEETALEISASEVITAPFYYQTSHAALARFSLLEAVIRDLCLFGVISPNESDRAFDRLSVALDNVAYELGIY